jgi:hypothetical protein
MNFPPLPDKVSILIARLSYDGRERMEVANWLVQTALELDKHPRVEDVFHTNVVNHYPTTRARNAVIKLCLARRIDFAVMIDDDMIPDIHSPQRAAQFDFIRPHRDQTNFFPSALDFALRHPGPCVVAAPYCAGPPNERVLVSRFREKEADHPDGAAGSSLQLECFTRDEAAERTGFEMVSALPTGLVLIDMRAISPVGPLNKPWFTYEFKDAEESDLASTEDTVFSRNLCYLGVPQYVAWGSWAGHVKNRIVSRPRRYPVDGVPKQVEAALRERVAREYEEAAARAAQDNPAALRFLAKINAQEEDDTPLMPLEDEIPARPAVFHGTKAEGADAILRDECGGEG